MKTNLKESNIENVTFGIELETVIPPESGIRVGPHRSGYNVPQAPKFENRCWKADGDPSIRGMGKACEFVSPVLKGQAGVQHLIEFLAWAKQVGAQVNSSCGLHIHVGIASYVPRDPSEFATFVNKVCHVASFYATALYAQTGTASRENGRWCAKPDAQYRNLVKAVNRSKDISSLRGGGYSMERYKMLNLCNVATTGTVEFRCFAGSLNPHKILLHLYSVLTICRIASQLTCLPAWEAKNVTGQEALWNLLSRQSHRRACCPQFADHWKKMVEAGNEMAAKYDQQKHAGQQPALSPINPALVETARQAAAILGTQETHSAQV